ncbi:transglutaminaseTgpA domain-containing protein [Asanoa sp. NPDC049573]|uniref:transglutaminase TgpA family protein n=1 Tax=Asanoa sp. NPDC049573 TaxID=3155396 RepID=UPI00343D99E3
MRSRRHMGLVAAVATLMAAAPLSTIFEQWTWLIQCTIAVALIAGAATVARTARAPVWAQFIAMGVTLLLALTWLFPSGEEIAGIVPWTGTLEHFGDLLSQSGQDMRTFAVLVPDSDPLLFVTVLGIGAVAVVVDLVVVGLRRPALAGLPMLAIYSVPVAVYSSSVSFLPFVVGAMGFLWLLVADKVDGVRRFGRRFTGDGRDVDVWEPSPLAAAGRRLAVVGVLLAVALPVAIPGMTSGLMSRFNNGAGDGTGMGDGSGQPGRVNLFAALQGQLRQNRLVTYARVTTTDPDPFYLRFAVADDVTSQGFRSRSPQGRSLRQLEDPRAAPRAGVTYEQYSASVDISTDFQMQFAPIYGVPIGTDGLDNQWLYDTNQQVIFSNRANTRDKDYSFDFVRANYTEDALRAADPPNPDSLEVKRFTQVPQVQQVRTKVNELIVGKTNTYDRVMAIYRFFSSANGFRYELQTEGGTSGEDIVNFLTNKKGYCQQYAATMAWMVRQAGIPARVAFGFTNGTSRDGDAMVLTNYNLHAWTEVYFGPEYGWVPFDATPRTGVPGALRPDYAPDPDQPRTTPSATPSAAAGAGSDDQSDLPGKEDPGGNEALPSGPAPTTPKWPFYTAGAVLLVVLLLGAPAFRRSALRRRRRISTAAGAAADLQPGAATVLPTSDEARRSRAHAHAAWDELMDTLVDYRVPVDLTETPRATAERLAVAELRGDATGAIDGVRLLGRAEERARYARSPLTGPGLTEAVRTVRRGLSSRATRRVRLVAAVFPPSVVARWKGAVVDVSTSAVTTVSRLRERIGRLSPRRLLTNRAR